eukprot:6958801-Heterocapsa_arctica.AAC.1
MIATEIDIISSFIQGFPDRGYLEDDSPGLALTRLAHQGILPQVVGLLSSCRQELLACARSGRFLHADAWKPVLRNNMFNCPRIHDR